VAFGCLYVEPLSELFDVIFGIYQLLPVGEEWVVVVADFEVQFRFRRLGFPRRVACVVCFDFVVLGVNFFL